MREIKTVTVILGALSTQTYEVGKDNVVKIEMDGTLTDTFYSIYYTDDTVMIVPLMHAIATVGPSEGGDIMDKILGEARNEVAEVVS